MSSLQGKIPGLMVTNSGSAGAEPDIKIRGIGTLNASSNPLYVVAWYVDARHQIFVQAQTEAQSRSG